MESITLTPVQQEYLEEFTRKGRRDVREINRAYTLLWFAKGKKGAEIEDLLPVERACHTANQEKLSTRWTSARH